MPTDFVVVFKTLIALFVCPRFQESVLTGYIKPPQNGPYSFTWDTAGCCSSTAGGSSPTGWQPQL